MFIKKGQYEVFAFAVKELHKVLSEQERKELCDTIKGIGE
jgi:hypothetical protein